MFPKLKRRICKIFGHSDLVWKTSENQESLDCLRCKEPIITDKDRIKAITQDLAEAFRTSMPVLIGNPMNTEPNPELAQQICDYLNELLIHDQNAVACLVANRVPCNEKLASHETVQVAKQNGGHHVGMLGILNGLCGIRKSNSYGLINAIFEGDANDLRNLVRFEVHEDPK